MIKYSKYLEDHPDIKYIKCGACDIGVSPYQDYNIGCNNCNATQKKIDQCAFCYKSVAPLASVCNGCYATREIFGNERLENIIPPNKWLKGIFIFIFLSLITVIIASIFDNPWILLIGGLLTGIISRKFSYGKNYAFDIHVIPDSSDWYR